MKLVVVVAILGTLAAFASLSYYFSQNYAQRIACLHNQEEMRDAVSSYAADNAGLNPARIWWVRRLYSDRPENFETCPTNHDLLYSYDSRSGAVTCPNPAHRPR
jgi:type II secretory pathway pseudopilin PulG